MKAKKVIKKIDEPVREVDQTPKAEVEMAEENPCGHNSLSQSGSVFVCLLCGREV